MLGFVGIDSAGLEGLELKYDSYLKRKPEEMLWGRDAKGNPLFLKESLVTKKRDIGYNILLTIDSRIQYLVDSQLNEAVQRTGAKGGIAIAMDPKTGAILAMSQEPGFNPNAFQKTSAESKKNRAVVDCFDPGSTFKPFVAAAALEEGVAKETDRFNCENGNYAVANRVFHEAQRHRYGQLTFREVLKYSSNIGAIKISQRLGKEKFYKYITDFGFGSKTGIDLPGEISGLLRPVSNWTNVDAMCDRFRPGDFRNCHPTHQRTFCHRQRRPVNEAPHCEGNSRYRGQYCQGVSAYRCKAGYISRYICPDGLHPHRCSWRAGRYGKRARIENVAVAGKTGTSQKFDFAAHRYSSERVRTSFIGFFPADNPKVVLFVMIDEPQRDKWGGVAAAPVFRNISEQILRRYENNIGNQIIEERELPRDTGIRLISAPENIPAVNDNSRAIVPDFRGLTMKQAIKLARERGMELKVEGSGWAVSQSPLPGIAMGENTACAVAFSR